MVENKSIVYYIREYFKKCPLLKRGTINVDYLNEKQKIEYSINPVLNGERTTRVYIDGSKNKVYPFTFSSVEEISTNYLDALEAHGFYDELERWIEHNNFYNILPEVDKLPDIKQAIRINVLTGGYVYTQSTEKAQFNLECELEYSVKRK